MIYMIKTLHKWHQLAIKRKKKKKWWQWTIRWTIKSIQQLYLTTIAMVVCIFKFIMFTGSRRKSQPVLWCGVKWHTIQYQLYSNVPVACCQIAIARKVKSKLIINQTLCTSARERCHSNWVSEWVCDVWLKLRTLMSNFASNFTWLEMGK